MIPYITTPRLIGLTGPAGCGKSTVAELLEHHGDYITVNFADPIYRGLSGIFGDDFMYCAQRAKEELDGALMDYSPSELLQTLGNEWGRNLVHPDLWVWLARRRWRRHDRALGSNARMVFADVGFENEAAMIRQHGGQLWHIVRPTDPVRDHISEAGIAFASGDRLIENTGTLEQLAERIREALDG